VIVIKNILFISPESWGKNFVSKHHYAYELAKQGYKVYFLNAPSAEFTTRIEKENLTIVDYKPIIRGLSKMPKFLSSYFIKKEIKNLEAKLNLSFDVIWNFDSSRFFNLSALSDKLRICHIVDMAEDIQRPLLAKTSDICFCTSDFIKKELLEFNNKVFKIHHGYKIPSVLQESIHLDYSKVQIGYVGNLTRNCINWNLIFALLDKYPNAIFNFVGSVESSNLSASSIESKILERLKSYSNVNLMGTVKSELIPSYLKSFDVLLSIYKIENESDVKQHSSLHKTMEYLGSGKTIVSTYSDEYKDKQELLEMTNSDEEFISKFDKVVNDLGFYNSLEKQNLRIEFASDNSYSSKIEEIRSILELNTKFKL
jgi:hypothetical protein